VTATRLWFGRGLDQTFIPANPSLFEPLEPQHPFEVGDQAPGHDLGTHYDLIFLPVELRFKTARNLLDMFDDLRKVAWFLKFRLAFLVNLAGNERDLTNLAITDPASSKDRRLVPDIRAAWGQAFESKQS